MAINYAEVILDKYILYLVEEVHLAPFMKDYSNVRGIERLQFLQKV